MVVVVVVGIVISSALAAPTVPLLPDSPLDLCSAGEARLALAVKQPVDKPADGGEQPADGAGEVDPHGTLKPDDVGIAVGVLVDVHLGSKCVCASVINDEKG